MKYRILIFFLSFIINLNIGYGQFLSNPSLEGPIGHSLLPTGWFICDELSTPDTQPGIIEVTLPPSDGNSYISMVVRGFQSPNAGHGEDCITQLLKPLLKNKCYKLQVDLAFSKELGEYTEEYGWVSFDHPVTFKIYGGNTSCQFSELFAQIDSIDNTTWRNFEFTINPQLADVNYLIFKADYIRLPIYPGNVLVDNVRLEQITPDDLTIMDTTINYGDLITLNASNAIKYIWSPDIGLSCNDCQNPVANAPYSITYTASLFGNSDCDNYKQTFIINVLPVIPNVITPNGDDKNDVFEISGLEMGTNIIITNRWGEVLYKNDNYDNTWDGKYKGSLLEPDTYWYIIKFPSIKKAVTGYVYLKL